MTGTSEIKNTAKLLRGAAAVMRDWVLRTDRLGEMARLRGESFEAYARKRADVAALLGDVERAAREEEEIGALLERVARIDIPTVGRDGR